jgi:hypothetical protein
MDDRLDHDGRGLAVELGRLEQNSPMVSADIFDATSPEACPPIPSATMKSCSSSMSEK